MLAARPVLADQLVEPVEGALSETRKSLRISWRTVIRPPARFEGSASSSSSSANSGWTTSGVSRSSGRPVSRRSSASRSRAATAAKSLTVLAG
jgi:hypothetical protein